MSQAGAEVPPLSLSPQEVAQASANASTSQKEILSDGVITFAEYESAIFAAVQCYNDAGVRISEYPTKQGGAPVLGPKLTHRGEYQYIPQFPAGTGQQSATDITNRCERDIVGVIRPLWLDHVSPTQQEVQAARDEMASCLRAAGLDAPQHPSQQELLRVAFPPSGQPPAGKIVLPPAYENCAAKAADQLGLPSFTG